MAQPYNTGAVNVYLGMPAATGAAAAQAAANAGTLAASAVGGIGGLAVGTITSTAVAAFLAQKTPFFLGVGETAPKIVTDIQFANLMSDRGGNTIPYDLLLQGKQAFVSMTLTIWNESVLNRLESMPSTTPSLRYADLFGDIGTLMMTEGAAPWLYCQFPYGWAGAGHPAMVSGGMMQGLRFLCAVPKGNITRESGTQPNKVHLMFHCIRGYNPATGAMVLADTNMAGIPLLPPN